MYGNQHKMLKQQNLANAVRAAPMETPAPGAPPKPDPVAMMIAPPKQLNPTQMATGAMGFDGGEGLKTPETYIYEQLFPNGMSLG